MGYWYIIIAYGSPINGTGFGNWFSAKHLRLPLSHDPVALQELCHHTVLCYLSTCSIKATVCSIRYFNW